MSNMSYCRFQNTLPDLRDCYDALHEDKGWEGLSYEEMRSCESLIGLCVDIAADFGDEREIIRQRIARIREERRAS